MSRAVGGRTRIRMVAGLRRNKVVGHLRAEELGPRAVNAQSPVRATNGNLEKISRRGCELVRVKHWFYLRNQYENFLAKHAPRPVGVLFFLDLPPPSVEGSRTGLVRACTITANWRSAWE